MSWLVIKYGNYNTLLTYVAAVRDYYERHNRVNICKDVGIRRARKAAKKYHISVSAVTTAREGNGGQAITIASHY